MDNNISSLGIDIKFRLVYAKRLFTIGIEHELLGSEMDRLVAVMHYDASIEHLLNTVLAFFEEPSKKEDYEVFTVLWDKVNSALEKNKEKIEKFKLPNRREIGQLHDVRNSAQHSGIIPSSESVQRFRQTAETFMENLIKNIFNLDYSEISLAILIQNEKIKNIIEEAEKCFMHDEFEKSMILSSKAFAIAKFDEQQRIFGSGSLIFKLLSPELPTLIKPRFKNSEIGQTLTNLIDYISKFSELTLEELEILKLRLDYKKYMHYKRFSPAADFSFGDKEPKITETDKKNYTYDNALFCLNFVIDSILKWESFKSQTYFEYHTPFLTKALKKFV